MHPIQRYLRLAALEPFRAFFPLGIVLGAAGIALWPLYQAGLFPRYPLMEHSRLMAQGFVGSFVIGFLLTAGPRLLGCGRPSGYLVSALVLLISGSAAAAWAGRWILADALFLVVMLTVLAGAVSGFRNRTDLPPPGFALALAGLLCAIGGGALMLSMSLGFDFPDQYLAAKILLFQGFPILPLIGVGAFFFPKLSGGRNTHDFAESRQPTEAWLQRAAVASAAATAFFVTVALELKGFDRAAYGLRALTVLLYLLFETPVFKRSHPAGPQRGHLMACSAALVASLAAIAFFPAMKIAWLHGFFILGLTGSILLVATRVALGHSGQAHLAVRSGGPLAWCMLILSAGATARIAASYAPAALWPMYLAASALWLFMAGGWAVFVAPRLLQAPSE